MAFDVVYSPNSEALVNNFVMKSGDTMTGPLTLSGSTLTVTGSAFSVGGSTFVVQNGLVGVGQAPVAGFSVYAKGSVAVDSTSGGFVQRYNGSSTNGFNILSNSTGDFIFQTRNTSNVERMRILGADGSVGIGTVAPASTLQIGTSLDATTSYLQIDTLAADTAGPPATADCDAATEVGRMVLSSRYTATADNMIWVCLQTAASTYAWWKTALTAP